MSPNIRRRRLVIGFAASLAMLAPRTGRGDTVDASSTTMLIVKEQTRAGGLVTLAPLYELLSVSAREVENPVAEHLTLVFSGWLGASLGDNLVWYDLTPPQHRVFGDLDLAYIQGEVLQRALRLRLGR